MSTAVCQGADLTASSHWPLFLSLLSLHLPADIWTRDQEHSRCPGWQKSPFAAWGGPWEKTVRWKEAHGAVAMAYGFYGTRAECIWRCRATAEQQQCNLSPQNSSQLLQGRHRFKQGLTEHKQIAGNEMMFLCQAMQIAAGRWRTRARNAGSHSLGCIPGGTDAQCSSTVLVAILSPAAKEVQFSAAFWYHPAPTPCRAGREASWHQKKAFWRGSGQEAPAALSTSTGQQGCAAGAEPDQGTALPAAQPGPRCADGSLRRASISTNRVQGNLKNPQISLGLGRCAQAAGRTWAPIPNSCPAFPKPGASHGDPLHSPSTSLKHHLCAGAVALTHTDHSDSERCSPLSGVWTSISKSMNVRAQKEQQGRIAAVKTCLGSAVHLHWGQLTSAHWRSSAPRWPKSFCSPQVSSSPRSTQAHPCSLKE